MNNDMRFEVRLSKQEYQKLQRSARHCRMSKSEYMRHLINGHTPKSAPPYNYYLMTKELNRIGGNLNQIARAANESGIVDAHKYKTVSVYLFEQIAEIKQAVCDPIPIEDFPDGDG